MFDFYLYGKLMEVKELNSVSPAAFFNKGKAIEQIKRQIINEINKEYTPKPDYYLYFGIISDVLSSIKEIEWKDKRFTNIDCITTKILKRIGINK